MLTPSLVQPLAGAAQDTVCHFSVCVLTLTCSRLLKTNANSECFGCSAERRYPTLCCWFSVTWGIPLLPAARNLRLIRALAPRGRQVEEPMATPWARQPRKEGKRKFSGRFLLEKAEAWHQLRRCQNMLAQLRDRET